MSPWLENGGPGLIEDVWTLAKMGDIPASYVIVYQRVYFLGVGSSAHGLGCWFGSPWFGFLESPKMKGIGILGCTPRLPNHRAPNQQLTIS